MHSNFYNSKAVLLIVESATLRILLIRSAMPVPKINTQLILIRNVDVLMIAYLALMIALSAKQAPF